MKNPEVEIAGWVTYTGRHIDLLRPSVEDIAIDDVAAALSKLNRFVGHTQRVYTVAEHCLRGAELCVEENRFEFLMHDASEAYLGDTSGPMKRLFGMTFYRELEAKWELAIGERFGLKQRRPKEVGVIDQRMLVTEQRDLMGRMPVSIDKVAPFAMHLGPVAPPQELLQRDFLAAFYGYAAKTPGARR